MEKETRLLIGKILGEIYRLQQGAENTSCPASPSHIYALLHGFEDAISDELEMIGEITSEQLEATADILDQIYSDPEKFEKFKGFYDIEGDLKKRDVSRHHAIKIIKYFKSNHQFIELIDKMDSGSSPAECRNFDLREFDL